LKTAKNILVSPLDWGLGHATRCIPIINHFLQLGHNVILGAYGQSKVLLEKEFPELISIDMPGINMTYQNKGSFAFTITKQITKYLKSIKEEHSQLQKVVKEYNVQLIVSDNRYGIYSPTVPSIIISHQINILMPKGLQFASSIVNSWVHKQLNKFDAIWIPDFKGKNAIAGSLSNNTFAHKHGKYLGILSRFANKNFVEVTHKNSASTKIKVLAVLSGPEPQRTIFEEILLKTSLPSNYSLKIIRGLPNVNNQLLKKDVSIINYLGGNELKLEIESCDIYIGRTGYTTIMDLLCIGKQAILVPTPGQPEQEYLGQTLANGNRFQIYEQDSFLIDKSVITQLSLPSKVDCFQYKKVIDSMLKQLNLEI